MARTTPWPPADVETFERLWREGNSLAQIARAMGKTRNAISGYADRRRKALRASGEELPKAKASAPPAPKAAKPAPKPKPAPKVVAPEPAPPVAKPAPIAPAAAVEPALVAAPSEGVAFAELSFLRHCKWPISAEGEPFRFCGGARDGVSSYCAAHRARGSTAIRERTPAEREANEKRIYASIAAKASRMARIA